MYYILNNKIALRSYKLIPYCYLEQGRKVAMDLRQEEFELLRKCDGKTYIEESSLLLDLLKRNLINQCDLNEFELSSWQKYKHCDNRYLPTLNLQITGKCNYNCRHCFNCKDNTSLQSEMSLEQIKKLLDECLDCGVTSFTITGGEPFIHPHFKEILKEIYDRNLFIFELNTNGYFINEEILDYMLSINCKPEIKISFDGLGYHDWMRQHQGAEKITLDAIKLCQNKSFKVRVQINVNKKNYKSIYPTVCLLDKMGIEKVRIIKTTDAPRWLQNGKGLDFTWPEFYDFLVDLFKIYAHEKHNLNIDVWQTLYYNATNNHYNIVASSFKKSIEANSYICPAGRRMGAISSNGEIYPCMQMQGFMNERNISFGNVFKDGLKTVLNDGKYIDYICLKVNEKFKNNKECASCKYNIYCNGGCPALAMLTGSNDIDSYLSADKTKCIMLKQDYYQKLVEAFGDVNKNLFPLEM